MRLDLLRTFLALGFVHLMCVGCSTVPEAPEAIVEREVRSLLRAVYDRDVSEVLGFVGPDGVVDGDQVISRDQVVSLLRDQSSYLYRSLFEEPTLRDIETCVEKLSGRLYVSPAAFVGAYGESYRVHVRRMEQFEGRLFGVKVESGGEAVPGCRYELFWLLMKVPDGKPYVASSFFQ